MLYLCKFIAKACHIVNRLRIVVGRFRKIKPLSERKVTIIHPNHAIKMAVADFVIRTWYPVLVISHFGCIHLQSPVCSKFVFVISWDLSN